MVVTRLFGGSRRLLIAAAVCLVAVNASAATFTLSPATLAFGNQLVNTASSPARTIILTNNGKGALLFTMMVSGDYSACDQCNGKIVRCDPCSEA
jgi:hypothetical protein